MSAVHWLTGPMLREEENGRGRGSRALGSRPGQASGGVWLPGTRPRRGRATWFCGVALQVRLNGCPLHTVKPDILRVKARSLPRPFRKEVHSYTELRLSLEGSTDLTCRSSRN